MEGMLAIQGVNSMNAGSFYFMFFQCWNWIHGSENHCTERTTQKLLSCVEGTQVNALEAA